MKQGLKRPIKIYIYHGLWIAWQTYFAFRNSAFVLQLFFFLVALLGLVALVYIIIRSNYMEVVDDRLSIYESVFRTTKIDLDKIEKIDFEPGPFTTSKIILKDKTKLGYSDSQAEFGKLKEFMGQFNIPVE